MAILREDFRILNGEGDEIFIRHLAGEGRPILLIHGARVPSVPSFDLPVEGGSFAADLVNRGLDVFLMDARGYGGSSRPAVMSGSPAGLPPIGRSDEIVRDILVAVDEVRRRTKRDKIAVFGWATGGHWMGQFAANFSHKVSHLFVHCALYGRTDGHPTLGHGSNFEDPEARGHFNYKAHGAYRLSSAASLTPPWDGSIPSDDKSQWREDAVAQSYIDTALASDTTSFERNPPSFRAPGGAMEDSFYLATGRQLWDASSIRCPTMVTRSELDFWSRPEDLINIVADLVSSSRVEAHTLPAATHFVHVDRPERGRRHLLDLIEGFIRKG